jgi:hypothetical protein
MAGRFEYLSHSGGPTRPITGSGVHLYAYAFNAIAYILALAVTTYILRYNNLSLSTTYHARQEAFDPEQSPVSSA